MPITEAFLDHRPLTPREPTLAGVIDAARVAAEAAGRVVIEVSVAGVALNQQQLADPATLASLSGPVECLSASPRELVAMSFRDVADALAQVRPIQATAAELIHTARLELAMPRLGEAMETWNAAQQALSNGLALVGIDPSSHTLTVFDSPEPLADSIAALIGLLGQLKRCLQAQDWAGLADVLAFDLDRQADRWTRILTSLANQIAPPS